MILGGYSNVVLRSGWVESLGQSSNSVFLREMDGGYKVDRVVGIPRGWFEFFLQKRLVGRL